MTTRRILSIDGGGIKGVFPASFLAELETHLPEPIGAYFDLIAGTSTGGIIALGLGLGFRAKELLSFYEQHGPEIFGGNRCYLWLRHWGLAKYDARPLRAALEQYFSGRTLGEARTRLVVPSMDAETGQVHIYKTAHHRRFVTDHRATVVDVALATSAAPTFFPTHTASSKESLIDGGMWANNPVGLAVVEGIGILGWSKDEIQVLSLGCTSEAFNIGALRTTPLGQLPWARKVANVFLAGQSSGSLGTAYVLLGHERVCRINVDTTPGRFALDAYKQISPLVGLGVTKAREAWPELETVFFNQPAPVFVPCHP